MLSVLLRFKNSDYPFGIFKLFCVNPFVLFLPFFNYLLFQSFSFGRTWWRIFLKRVVRNKLDIYVCIAIIGLIPLLVNYYSRWYYPPSSQCFGTKTCFIKYIYYCVQFLSNVIIMKTKALLADFSRFVLSYLDPLILLLPNTFQLFDFLILRIWAFLM